MSIKDIFLEAFGRFAAGDFDVLREVIRDDFVNHDPETPRDKDGWIEATINGPIATSTLDLKRTIADDEFVVIHYQLIPQEGGLGEAVVDVWRFEGDLIVEHWDVSEPVTAPDQV
ncbi:nuclear transport factor 2 family protein [Actinoplanes sp. NPDC051851]|uniref:nuclear transport factor 2 family protein n=1 Tax=Actinoplanes sp. NPDC051851 TaxID=3154753 RepID=UPI00341C5A85